MLQFHEHIITELLDDPQNGSGLVVLSSGLFLPRLIAALLLLLHTPSQGTLLILSPHQPFFKSQLLHHFHPNPIPEISADLPSHHRHSLYTSSNVFFITPRILIVDLLTSKLRPPPKSPESSSPPSMPSPKPPPKHLSSIEKFVHSTAT
ncbi:hypothetical protein ACFX2C_046106 [Malus domestica]